MCGVATLEFPRYQVLVLCPIANWTGGVQAEICKKGSILKFVERVKFVWKLAGWMICK